MDSEDWDFWRCRREALFARSFEFDSRRGVVRDRIAAIMHEWIGVITRAIYDAQNAGHVDPKVDPTRLAFEGHGIAMGAHWACQLLDDRQAYSRARTTLVEKLRSVATAHSPQRLQAKGCGVLLEQSLNKCLA